MSFKSSLQQLSVNKRSNALQFKKLCSVMLLLCCSYSTIEAQAPAITKNITIPSGNANSKGVAYGNGVYVTVLSAGTIYMSSNGDTWTKVFSNSTTLSSITFGNGIFVVAGYNGLILSSTNGTSWTTRTSNTTETFLDVNFLNSQFYVVGYNRTLLKSSDGITWTGQSITAGLASDYLFSITYGAGTYIITSRGSLAGGNQSQIYKSTTGASGSWTLQNLNNGMVNKIQWINDRFFSFMLGNEIFTSTNGTTWVNVTGSITLMQPDGSAGVWNTSHQIFNGFYDGTKYYFYGGSEYYGGYGSVYTATTGLNLTLQTKTAYIVTQGSAYLNGKYFTTGNEGIVSSNDGSNYKYPTGNYFSSASSGSGYVGVGTVASNNGQIFTSPDFNTWTEKTPLGMEELYGVVYNGSKYVAVGDYAVAESVDNGNTWTKTLQTDSKTGVTWGNNKFVAVGYGTTGQITNSANGTTWSTVDVTDNGYFKIKYVNGNFFALGYENVDYQGVIMHSTDGTTWTSITPTLSFNTYYFNDVVWDGTKYHFMGAETSSSFFSVSTATPTNPTSFTNKGTIVNAPGGTNIGGDWGQGAFGYSNGHFVGSVNDMNNNYETYVVYSDDGISWTAVNTNENVNIQSAITEGNTVRLMGQGDGKITVAYGVLAVNFLDVNATLVNGKSLIKWQTSTEQNTYNFLVQHTTNGFEWNTIGTVNAYGTGAAINNYNFVHKTPVKGVNNYRIVEKDVNGQSIYSKIVKVIISTNNGQLVVYPNPVSGNEVTIQLRSASLVSLYNSKGELVLRKDLLAGTQQLNLTGIASGVYTIKVGEETRQIIIQ